jgi:O-antigen chain-terminating methyltransferase
MNVDEIMYKIREETAQRSKKHDSGINEIKNSSSITPKALHDNVIYFKGKDKVEYKKEYDLSDFLKYHDTEFIQYAYSTILRRQPDKEGFEYYLTHLRNGTLNKIEMLGRLRYSPEGKSNNVKIKGLIIPFVFNVISKIPVVGYPVRLSTALIRLPNTLKNLQGFESFTHTQFRQHDARIDNAVAELKQLLTEMALEKADIEAIDELNNELVALLSIKADREAVKEVEERLQGAVSLLKEVKADRECVQNLQNEISLLDTAKANSTEVGELSRRVGEEVGSLREQVKVLEETKAEGKAVKEVEEQLQVVDERVKSEGGAVDEIRKQLGSIEAGKADFETVEEVREAVARIATNKVDIRALDEINEQMNVLNEKKAAKEQVDELQNRIEEIKTVKADKEITDFINQELKDILRQIRDHKLNILDQQRRLSILLQEARKRLPKPFSKKQIQNMLKEEEHLFDALYVSFEDQFRGTREDVKERQKIYLPYIDQAGAGTKDSLILDVGCGRGEWLGLLKERGYAAKGVDINRVMVEQCKELGLDVIESDVIEFLQKQKKNNFGSITGFHIIEHLSLKKLIALFDESLRVLKPGGMVIFETPNPENLIVGSNNFYTDLTHRRPIPSQTLQFFIESRGFNNLEILKLHRNEGQKIDNELLQHLLFGEQDYAVIGYKA